MKLSAFTIVYPPSLPWLYQNMLNCADKLDEWIVIENMDPTMVEALYLGFNLKNASELEKRVISPYNTHRDRIRTLFPNVRYINVGVRDKLYCCNDAYNMAKYNGSKWAMHIDSDEWYTPESIDTLRGLLPELPIGLYKFHEIKFWMFYFQLLGKEWQSTPGRLHYVDPNMTIKSHRPPALEYSAGGEYRKYECNPVNNDNTVHIGEPCYHFNYVDPIQVLHKSLFFTLLRKNSPIYSRYFNWYKQYYLGWNRGVHTSGKPWQYHVTQDETAHNKVSEFDIKVLKQKFPRSANFLSRYYDKDSAL